MEEQTSAREVVAAPGQVFNFKIGNIFLSIQDFPEFRFYGEGF